MVKGAPRTTNTPKERGGGFEPKASATRSPGGQSQVVVSFEFADRLYSGTWTWPVDSEANELLTFLCEISSSTWGEIQAQQTGGRNRHRKHHSHSLDSVVQEARARIEARRLDEIFEELFRFRLSGTKRLWGFLAHGVFYVLWWDRGHDVVPSSLRHT